MVYRDPSGKSKAVIKSVARENGKGAFYKIVDFAGKVEVMNAQELCQDAQEKPKVVGRKACGRARSQQPSTENEVWAAEIKAERMRLKRARKREKARKARLKSKNAPGEGADERLTDLTGNGPEGNPISENATAAACSASAYRGGVFNSMD